MNTHRMLSLILLAVLGLAPGCASLGQLEASLEQQGWAHFDHSDELEQGVRVTITTTRRDGSWVTGSGAVIGKNRVLTVAHVVAGAESIEVATEGSLLTVTAKVVRRQRAFPEDICELELEVRPGVFGFEGFSAKETFTASAGEARRVWTQRGLLNLPCPTVPGDSGSPVLNAKGELVGVLVGRLGGRAAISFVEQPAAGAVVARAF